MTLLRLLPLSILRDAFFRTTNAAAAAKLRSLVAASKQTNSSSSSSSSRRAAVTAAAAAELQEKGEQIRRAAARTLTPIKRILQMPINALYKFNPTKYMPLGSGSGSCGVMGSGSCGVTGST